MADDALAKAGSSRAPSELCGQELDECPQWEQDIARLARFPDLDMNKARSNE